MICLLRNHKRSKCGFESINILTGMVDRFVTEIQRYLGHDRADLQFDIFGEWNCSF